MGNLLLRLLLIICHICVNNSCLTEGNKEANLQAMGSKRKRGRAIILILIIFVIVLGAAAAVYFFAFDRMTIVSDSSFSLVVPQKTLTGMRLKYAMRGIRLIVAKLPDECFYSPEIFKDYLGRIRSSYVLLAPLSSAYAVKNRINVSNLLPSSKVLAIYDSEGSNLFDCTLVSDMESSWKKVASEISSETSTMSQNVGLVYDSDSKNIAEAIISSFPAGRVTSFDKSDSGRLFASSAIEEMNRLGIVIALCPSVDSFSDFFKSETSISWITDYRLSLVVPDKNLYGIIIPDFYGILDMSLSVEKGARTTAELEYLYEKK